MSCTAGQLRETVKSPGSLDLPAEKADLLRATYRKLQEQFHPASGQEVYGYFVPGRIEVLGKHTDYVGGPTVVMAIDRGFFVLSTPNGTDRVNVTNIDPRHEPISFPFSREAPEMAGTWGVYASAAARRVVLNFGQVCPLTGADVVIASDLPPSGGLGSSSALITAMFFALAGPNRLQATDLYCRNIHNSIDLAMYLAVVENGLSFRELIGSRGVGTFGGSEDHAAILCCKPETLSVNTYCPTAPECEVAFPREWAVAVCHSGRHAVKTGKAMAEYNAVSERARAVLAVYNRAGNRALGTLREVVRELQDDHGRVDFGRMRESLERSEAQRAQDLFERFEQFAVEMVEIIPEAVDAVRERNADRLGRCVDRSHSLSRSHLRNIVPEVDCLQGLARAAGAIAASGFGAGFGGSVYAIVRAEGAADFLERWRAAYEREYPQYAGKLAAFVTRPAGPATNLFS
jgi:galactokinase